MDLDKLEKLNALKEKGIITEQEFVEQKQKILSPPNSSFQQLVDNSYNYCMLMHLAQFCAFVLPFLGWIVPLVMWMTKKEDEFIDQQGKVIFNWILSVLVYFFVSLLLTVILIGFPMLLALVICSIVFTIMGALHAKDGIVKNYPLAIRFFRVEESQQIFD
jgi:uncharacterized Tic20 family protein